MSERGSDGPSLDELRSHVNVLKGPLTAQRASGAVTGLDRWLLRRLLAAAENPPIAVRLWNGEDYVPPGTQPKLRMHVLNRAAIYKLLLDPHLYFGDLYSQGDIDVEGDLVAFLETCYRAVGEREYKLPLRRRRRPDSLSGSRENIHHHYDIGNDFYELWLDREVMQYTCAYFPDPAMTLEQAQVAKLHHVCRKLWLRPGLSVVEAGCGWGGLARFMARHYGVRVRAYNISHEQVEYAREQARREGLDDKVEYVEDDYRNISGRYDVFVSVGMLEHVGIENYGALAAVIDRCLRDDGRGLIHSIGRNQPGLMNAWIERRIFPGACPPSLGQMAAIFEPVGLSVLDVENLRVHYARTLEHWMERFDEHTDKVRRRYGEAFVRAWRLYLAGSIAAFTTGSLQLFQVVFARPQLNELPWSRAHLYRP